VRPLSRLCWRVGFVIGARLAFPLAAPVLWGGSDLGRSRRPAPGSGAAKEHALEVNAMPARPVVCPPRAEMRDELHLEHAPVVVVRKAHVMARSELDWAG